MFKKFKDKLAEEMKQSPSRLQAGMQQLAQAVISPAASNNLIPDITTSIDDLNQSTDDADTVRNNSAPNQFQSVDLQASNSMERSRRSSYSSVTSENFFPSYESPGNLYHLQSDMEQSASEFEDSSSSSQLEHVTKDELYAGYQKLRKKYTKYRAVYRELYKENMKMKSVLVETQDKALRRISNLKEQCQLEQEAKAHLEEALRNDIEEKDHLINALNTKIKLLQPNGSNTDDLLKMEPDEQSEKNSIDLLTDSPIIPTSTNDNLIAENSTLKEKVKKFETLLAKCNESLKRNKEKIAQLTENRDILERDLNLLQNSSTEQTALLETELFKAKREISSLNEQVDVLKKREEDSALSLAENKLFIHRELEVKEEQNKQLQQDLKKITEYKDILAEAVVKYDHEFKQFEVVINDRNSDIDKKISQLQELFTNKSEAIKLVQQDVKHKFIGIDEVARSKNDKEFKQKKDRSSTTADDNIVKNEEVGMSRDELELKNTQLLGLTTELKSCKSTINDLKEMLREVTMEWEQVKREKECLIANILEYKRIIGTLRRDCNSMKTEIKQHYSGQGTMIDSVNKKIVTILNSVEKSAKYDIMNENENKITVPTSEHTEPRKSPDVEKNSSSLDSEASSVELKTIINENNALRKKCEQLIEQTEHMKGKCDEFDNINLTNIKLIAEIDELNFKLRDIAELQESQYKLQLEMEGLKEKSQFGNNADDKNEQFVKQVSSLQEKLNNYDLLSQDNAALKQESVELKNKLAATLINMEALKSEQSKNIEIGIDNFSQKCTEYENTIVNLTSKFTEQTRQLEELHNELAKQKVNFRELNDRYELRNSEFKETNEAFAKQALEMRELNEKYKTQCSEIEILREKETEILNQLDETVKVRQEMITKFNELEVCKNNIIDTKNNELEELRFNHDNMIKNLELAEKKIESMSVKTDEIRALSDTIKELRIKIEQLEAQNSEIEPLKNNVVDMQLKLEKLTFNNVEVQKSNKELKEERNNLAKLNSELKIAHNNLEQANDKLTQDVANLENQIQHLHVQLDAEKSNSERYISQLNKELENSRTEIQIAETKKGDLASQVSQLLSELQKFENLRQANAEQETRIIDLNQKIQEFDKVEAENLKLLGEAQELNDKIAELVSSDNENRTLISEIENLKREIADLKTHKAQNVELLNELKTLNESNAESMTHVQGLREENSQLALQTENLQISINEKEVAIGVLENSNIKLLSEFENLASNQSKALDDKSKAIHELEGTVEFLQNKIAEQQEVIDALTITSKELRDQLAEVNAHNSKSLDSNVEKIDKLEKTGKELENEVSQHRQVVDALKITNQELLDQLAKVNFDHSKALETETRKTAELEEVIKDYDIKLAKQRTEIQAEQTTTKELQNQLTYVSVDHSKTLEDKTRTITELKKEIEDFKNTLIGRQEEVETLESTIKDLREQLMSITENKSVDDALQQSYDVLRNENKELHTRLDEAVILYETKESQIETLNQQLKEQTQILTDKLKTNEEEQSMRIKQLVKEFQAQIHDKDEQIQAALEKRFERQQNYESDLIQQYKEQLKDFQVELTTKSEQIENLILDNKETIQAYKDQIEELTQAIAEVKKDHSNELQNIEQNWKSILKQRTDQLESKHVDEVNELTKEWLTERKAAENSDTSPGELEGTSRVAMATIQSNTGSLHSLQQTLLSQKRELSELRKLLRIRNESLEGSTEIEYLRNILFEYMMGRETLVLTRVISAVVKFDQEQTSKVIKKEEDKLTLLGSLGLL